MIGDTFRGRLVALPAYTKRAIVAASDATVLAAVLTLSLTLLGLFPAPAGGAAALGGLYVITLALGLPVLAAQGLYRVIIRFVGFSMAFAVVRGASLLALTVGLAAIALNIATGTQALAVALVFWAFAILGLVASRLLMRSVVAGSDRLGERVAIYGAGRAGLRLVAAAAHNPEFRPVVFVDDDTALQGRVVAGLPVVPADDLREMIALHRIDRILLALPSAGRRKRQDIIERLSTLQVRLQTVPDIADLLTGRARLEDVRDVGVDDLLGREPVPPNPGLLDACIRGKSVLVTGAGGSIGSELCRQILELRPTRLVLYELCEHQLYSIDRELSGLVNANGLDTEIVALLGSVCHRDRLRGVMSAFGIETVYHAAAYKHVPIVEFNVLEGIHNNVIGTWHTAEAAEECGVETFVLISTDKAVLPANVMGATKRLAELVLQGMAERGSRTRFCMVRFGNVLESSGSVVPLFRDQIRRGGPVTVTHPEVTRYFMTIPEAAQLVIQAGSLGQGGDVFVLDMGEPVRIADLARRMINLMGMAVRDADHPDGDIAIEYTGLRAGEKLYEELLIGNEVARTEHPMIMRAVEERLAWPVVKHYLAQLMLAGNASDCARAHTLLQECVTGFVPVTDGIGDLVWRARGGPELPVAEEPAPPPRVRPAEISRIAG